MLFGSFTLLLALSCRAQTNEKRLIETSRNDAEWRTEDEILDLIRQRVKFMDITDGDLNGVRVQSRFEPPVEPTQQAVVRPLAAKVSTSYMKDFLTSFSGFHTRYYKSAAGRASNQWLFDRVSELADKASSQFSVNVSYFRHDWGQHSIIARVEPAVTRRRSKPLPAVVLSAHQDSVNQWNPWFGRSPGADDDGSGTTTVFEVFRLVTQSDFVPKRPIEFHWYSAEEGGLLGSQKVVAHYAANDIPVVAAYQMDMTGFKVPNKKEIIGLATDFVDPSYSQFLKLLVNEYCDIPYQETKCGYACSDHASWNKAGYPSVFTFETDFNNHSPFIHTADDVVENLSFDHMAQFVKAGLGWVIELSA